MDKFQKYSRLMLLLAGGIVGFILFIALVIYILRLFSMTVLHIPGFDRFYQYVIILIPYTLFFAAYYYLYKKIHLSKSKPSRITARILLCMGCIAGILGLALSTAVFLHVKNSTLGIFGENLQYALVTQLVIIFIVAGALAGGDAKEKDWMER